MANRTLVPAKPTEGYSFLYLFGSGPYVKIGYAKNP